MALARKVKKAYGSNPPGAVDPRILFAVGDVSSFQSGRGPSPTAMAAIDQATFPGRRTSTGSEDPMTPEEQAAFEEKEKEREQGASRQFNRGETLRVNGLMFEDRGGDSVYVQARDALRGRKLSPEAIDAIAHDMGLSGVTFENANSYDLQILRALKDEAEMLRPPPATEAEKQQETAEAVGKEFREKGEASKEEYKALGKKAHDGLLAVNDVYQKQMSEISGEVGKKSAEAYKRMNAGFDKMDKIQAQITDLMEKGAMDSPFVQRQIAAFNTEVDAAAEQARSQLSAKMAARGFGGSNEQIYLEAKLQQDVGRAKATGAVDIEGRFIQFQAGMLQFQSGLALSEAQFFGNQFEQFSGIQIGIETAAAQAGAELGVKAVGIETGLTQAGIAVSDEFTKAAGAVEVGGAEFAANLKLQSDALKQASEQWEKMFTFETEVKFPTMTQLQREQIAAGLKAANNAAEKQLWGDMFQGLAIIGTIFATSGDGAAAAA